MKKVGIHSGIPPPRQYFGRCETCGTYPISEKTARQFLTKALRKKLDEALRQGAHGAILTFKGGCPVCRPNEPVEVELSALRPKVQ